MRQIIRLLVLVLEAIIGITEDKQDRRYMPVYEAQDRLDAGLIAVHEYNHAFERKDVL